MVLTIPWSQTCSFYEQINFCCSQLPSFWHFLMLALRNSYREETRSLLREISGPTGHVSDPGGPLLIRVIQFPRPREDLPKLVISDVPYVPT